MKTKLPTTLDALAPSPRNPRKIGAKAMRGLKASLKEFGDLSVLTYNVKTGAMVAGHQRREAIMGLRGTEITWGEWHDTPNGPECFGLLTLPTGEEFRIRAVDWDPVKEAAANIAANSPTIAGEFTPELQELLREVQDGLPFVFEDLDFAALLEAVEQPAGSTEPDDVPEAPEDPTTRPGDVWLLGRHRLMCGDSTRPEDVAKLMNGQKAVLCHADPPYGMGKEADGVENDNLYRAELDAFQMRWWRAFRPYLTDNASGFIWGNALDLWRLWWTADIGPRPDGARGLGASEELELRNEIVWDKSSAQGMMTAGLTQYPVGSERALFFQLGKQFLGNVNKDDFPATWEPIRSYMEGQGKAAGLKPDDVKRVCGVGMYSHWFSKSQFNLIPEQHYKAIADAYPGHFTRPWKALKREWDAVKGGAREGFLDEGGRSYFDNAHEPMRDVWEFPRVSGEERHGHATPKPVAMISRALKSSAPVDGLVVEPFIGSGTTLIAAQETGRVCYGMEITPAYCDVTVRRWEAFTGKMAVLEG